MKIKKIIWGFYSWFTNPTNERIVGRKVYLNYIFLLASLVFMANTAFNAFMGLYLLALYAFILLLLVLLLWTINRNIKKTNIPTLGGLLVIFISANLFYIENNGLYGPTAFYIFPLAFIVMYFGKKKHLAPIIFLILLNVFVFSYLEFHQHIQPKPYDKRSSQYLDNYMSFIITIGILIVFFADIIKIHLKEKEIAAESNKLKTAFLANTSHDIRNPVNAILGFCTLLADGDIDDKELKKHVQIIQSNSNQLLTLTSEIFDISMIESGDISLQPKYFDINKLIWEIQTTYSQIIDNSKKDIYLQAHCGLHDKQCLIYADPIRIHQVLSNIIQNAVNYTKDGAIIFGYDMNIDTKRLIFYVKDTGTGIPEDQLENIFNRNITNVNNTYKNSSGLGLHISKSLIKLMKGKIWAESPKEGGAHFKMEIPIEEDILRSH